MTVHKGYNEKRAKILEAAYLLFSQTGYENTAVCAIAEVAGISKATFYHYFESKEDLINSLVESLATKAVEKMREISSDNSFNALKKLYLITDINKNWQIENRRVVVEMLDVLYRNENVVLLDKMRKGRVKLRSPVFSVIIQQGINEGVFSCTHVEKTAELIVEIINIINDEIVEVFLKNPVNLNSYELFSEKIDFYNDAVKRILGAMQPIKIADVGYIKEILEL